MSTNDDNKKLPTGITGLDAIFHGGIHTHNSEGNNKGIVMLARGQHGVNKIHLSMQICEGLNCSKSKDAKIIDILKRNELAITYNSIKDKRNDIIASFDKIIRLKNFVKCSSEKERKNKEVEKKKWEEHKKEFESNFEKWFIDIAPKLISIRGVEEKNIPDDCENVEKFDWETYYTKPYAKIKDSIIFNKETIKDFLENIYKVDKEQDSIKDCPSVVFISLNKDIFLLKNSYYDFYIQRLIRNIRNNTNVKSLVESLVSLHSMSWKKDLNSNGNELKIVTNLLSTYKFPSITGGIIDENGVKKFLEDIQTGFIYYNGRTHGLHVRHQKGAYDTGGMLLCKLEIPDDYKVRIIGKDTLNDGVESADGLTTFQKMMKELDEYKDKYKDKDKSKEKEKETKGRDSKDERPEVDIIMIDGLSRLNEEELSQCPLNTLSDKLRAKSQVAIITADKKLLPSNISTDIVLDMEILQSERPDHQYTALKVSKCLYQKNAYGWHRYKMRNAGIEVIPSIHLQMGQRFLMDDIVTDAVLPINEYPYPFWLNENETTYFDDKELERKRRENDNSSESITNENIKDISDAKEEYYGGTNRIVAAEGTIFGILLATPNTLIEKLNSIFPLEKLADSQHILFINFDHNRSSFYSKYVQNNSISNSDVRQRIHLFNFQSGYIPADEFLWSIDQQVQSIEKIARNGIKKEEEKGLATHYKHVNLIIGDLNYIHYAYPCLSAESLLLPALATYTKKHHMTNYVYATVDEGRNVECTELHKKEIETIMQMRRITKPFDEPLGKINVFEKK